MRYIFSPLIWIGVMLLLIGGIGPSRAFADDYYDPNDWASKNSCLAKISFVDRAIDGMVTVGVSEYISEGFRLENADKAPEDRPDGEQCKDFSSTVHFCYNPLIGFVRAHPKSATNITDFDCNSNATHTMNVGDKRYIDGAWFQVVNRADQVCVQYFATVIWRTLGCKYRTDPTVPYNPNLSCFIGASCASTAARHSKSFLSITGVVAECISETMQKLFQDTSECINYTSSGSETQLGTQGSRNNLFTTFQQAMKKSVSAALTLYVIFFGIKVVLGQEVPSKEELFVTILKLCLVVYFALSNGLGDFLYPAFSKAGTDLASIMFRAGGARGLCAFDGTDPAYAGNTGMALWDALDCRIAFYLGLNDPNRMAVAVLLWMCILLLPLFFFHLIFIIFSIAFAIFFISIAMYVLHNYVICLMFMTFTLYLGPLFVPMVLFKQTRGYFDGWVKLLISFTLQPVILFGFLALILTIFDNIAYTKCQFGQFDFINPLMPGKAFPVFYIDLNGLSSADARACKDSFGYQLSLIAADPEGSAGTIDMVFFKFKIFSNSALNNMFIGMTKLVFFGFIAAHFLEVLNGFAAELTGGQQMKGVSITPFAFAGKLGSKISPKSKNGKGGGKGEDPSEMLDKASEGMDNAGGGGGG